MSSDNLVGNIAEKKAASLASLINGEIYHLITHESHDTPFSFNMIKIFPEGLIKTQTHQEQHVVFILNGVCKILLDEKWISAKKGDYIYIPPNMTHSFSNSENIPVELLILKI